MNPPAASFRVHVDPTNPGQFFACCALLELADRLDASSGVGSGARGWFADGDFCVHSGHNLAELLKAVTTAELLSLDAGDNTACPIGVGGPFNLRLDWWKSDDRRLTDLKVWAGTMECLRIARAMQKAMRDAVFITPNLFNIGAVARDPDDPLKKVEPFYFDARRGPNAHSRDVGFAINDLGLTTTAHPAVEFLCLVGLQRGLPPVAHRPRFYDYSLWPQPVEPCLLPAAVAGLLPGSTGYRFESWYRTGQKKHKAFLRANPRPT